MDPRLLRYYNRELEYLREAGAEFAREYPKIASRLGLEGLEVADPYVERLLEGFAFLTARVQLRLDAEFPKFTQHLLEAVYPHYLAPIPSTVIVRLTPDRGEGALADGVTVPRGSRLRSQVPTGQQTACEYRTAQDVTLWPVQVVDAHYHGSVRDLVAAGLPERCTDVRGRSVSAAGGLRLRLQTMTTIPFSRVVLDRLTLFLGGSGDTRFRLLEQLVARTVSVVVRASGKDGSPQDPDADLVLPASVVRHVGLGDDEALLPAGPRTFEGYRLLQEYFTCPERFLFVSVAGLKAAAARCSGRTLDLWFLFDRMDPELERSVQAGMFELHCTPAVNLFEKRCDRIPVDAHATSFHVVVDRTRPMDYEVHGLKSVHGHGDGEDVLFRPLYGIDARAQEERSYFTVQREPRLLSMRQRRDGKRSSYLGHEMYISIVDAAEQPVGVAVKQLSATAWCTNRDLPLHMPVGGSGGDFQLDSGAPVEAIHVLVGPTAPRPSRAMGESAWRFISHLSLNHLSLLDDEKGRGAVALRELLALYGDASDPAVRKQIDGLLTITATPVTRRLMDQGPISFGRGIQIQLTCDEEAFEGAGAFVLGAVLEQFFARYVTLNAFTETVLRSRGRGEVHRWPMRTGRKSIL